MSKHFIKRFIWRFAAALALAVLAACGGGGGGGGTPPPAGSTWDQMIWDQDKWG